jgi:NAD(P)-dependent dehydrogenase (short-subunit alcohol dehydrogenase family)
MGQTAVITGGNSGIGFMTARELVRRGWRVIITGRDEDKLGAAADALAREGPGAAEWRKADFASFAQVRALAQSLSGEPRIDLLINNIGVALTQRRVSEDGNEMMLQVNHLAPFLLTNLLIEKLKASAPARIVNVSSRMHRNARDFGFGDFQFARFYHVGRAYARTKLYNILFTRELSRRLAGTGVTANALHPGMIRTEIGRDGDLRGIAGVVWPLLQRWYGRPLEEGSRVPLHLATAPELEGVSGKYFTTSLREAEPGALAQDDAAARTLWEMSAKAVGLEAPAAAVPEPAPVKLFVPPGHYYSPIVHPVEAERRLAALEAAPVPDALPGIRLDRPEMVRTWRTLVPFLASIPFPDRKEPRYRYAFENDFYSWGDGSVLHAMLRLHRPRRLVEIGSGWSSACTLDTVEHYMGGDCELTFIEPFPQSLRDLIGHDARARIIEAPVQQVPLAVFTALQEGDVLFIDSTHVLRTGGDVCFELFEILPRLARGVLVHFHDMFWPFEYPRRWAVDENRSWNELYAVRLMLSGSDDWRIVLFNDYLGRFERPMIEATYPPFLNNPGGALWLQRR